MPLTEQLSPAATDISGPDNPTATGEVLGSDGENNGGLKGLSELEGGIVSRG